MSTPLCSLLLLSAASVLLIGCSHSSRPPVSVAPTTVQATTPTTVRPTSYVVQAGDSLAAIAARFGLTPAQLSVANGIADPDKILVGQRLSIPAPTTTAVTTTPSTVPPTTLPPATAAPSTLAAEVR